MNQFKNGLLAAAAFLGVSATFFMASCEKDSCTSLNCKHGTCADNFCRCPAGYEGAECEIRVADKFLGKWYGATQCSIPGFKDSLGAVLTDSMHVFYVSETKVGLTRWRVPGDTLYGRPDGQQVLIDEQVSGNARRYSRLVYNNRVLTFYDLHTPDVNSAAGQYNCTFTGLPDTTARIPQQ